MQLARSIGESQKLFKEGDWKRMGEGVWRATLIGTLLFFFQVFSGIDAVLGNTVDVFHSAGSTLNDYHCTIMVGAVQVVRAIL